ncbi:MAG: 4'-phosphopantetheinyl transferase family protein [Angustibacter sp.]
MIADVLPRRAVAVEAFDDAVPAPLFPIEERVVARAVERRRREYATGRRCVREALAQLGYATRPLLADEKRAPIWPDGVVGSITHCDGYRAAVVARSADLWTVGVDAEPHAPLPDGVLASVASAAERVRLPDTGRVRFDRLLFSAKESVYKAWYPLTGRWLGFENAEVRFGPADGRFRARLLVPGPVLDGAEVTAFDGRWLCRRGLVLTAITVARREREVGPASIPTRSG